MNGRTHDVNCKRVMFLWFLILQIIDPFSHRITSLHASAFASIVPHSLHSHSNGLPFRRSSRNYKSYAPQQEGRVLEENTNNIYNHTFWRKVRTEKEMKEFATRAVFLSMKKEDLDNVEVLSTNPPFLLIHNILPDNMCDEIIDAVENKEEGTGLKRSTTGATQESSDIRTSQTTWLRDHECHGPLREFADRVSRLSGLPQIHQENLQVVKYENGQKFDLHTDHIDSYNELECRGRLATCLLYLNDAYVDTSSGGENGQHSREKNENGAGNIGSFTGGNTRFPEFDVSVLPRKGSGIFFWNTVERPGVDGYDPLMDFAVDMKLRHAGEAVLTGEKWACNRWIHPVAYGAGVRGV